MGRRFSPCVRTTRGEGPSRRLFGLFFALSVFLGTTFPACAMAPRADPATGRIRVLHIGDGLWGSKPGLLLASDPKLDVTIVPVITVWYTSEEISRYMRLYMPRGLDDLVKRYDLVLLGDCDASVITPMWQQAFSDAVLDRGLGLLMTGGHRGLGGGALQKGLWKGTIVEQELLPVEVVTQGQVDGPIRIRVLRPNNPLMASIPWSTAPPLGGANEAQTKQAAVELADDGKPTSHPILCFWDIGRGRGTALMETIHGGGDSTEAWVRDWAYWPDFVLNLVYFSTAAEVPQDPQLMHQIRSAFELYQSKLALLGDLLNFIERFGASPAKIEDGLRSVRQMKKEADRLYLKQEYQHVLDRLLEVEKRLDRLQIEATKARKRALLWVYLVEWMSVLATSLIVGVVIWSLMIRRRLYREAGVTTLRRYL